MLRSTVYKELPSGFENVNQKGHKCNRHLSNTTLFRSCVPEVAALLQR